MKVELVSHSESFMKVSSNLEGLVAFCARVSNPTNQINGQSNEKLIRYLIQHDHWSPFEMVNICLEIESTRDIIRQILRHRSFSFQEFSQRYAISNMGFETKEARLQDTKNRQNSIETNDTNLKEIWIKAQQKVADLANDTYLWAIENGIAKEQARSVLPEGMTVSKIYMNGTLRSWVHYIQLRSDNGTQKEHREIAIQCAKSIEHIFPMIMEFVSI